jgi:hypothetical protein
MYVPSLVPRWKEDEPAFERHFHVSYDDFCELATVMAEKFPEKMVQYEKILVIDEEAAILWLIKHARSYGIIKEDD